MLEEDLSNGFHRDTLLARCQNGHLKELIVNNKIPNCYYKQLREILAYNPWKKTPKSYLEYKASTSDMCD